MNKSKKDKTMVDVTNGYESFIKDKKIKAIGKAVFDKTIKKAATPKQRGSK